MCCSAACHSQAEICSAFCYNLVLRNTTKGAWACVEISPTLRKHPRLLSCFLFRAIQMLQLSNCICLINCCEDDCEAEVILILQVKLSADRWTPTMRTPERVRSRRWRLQRERDEATCARCGLAKEEGRRNEGTAVQGNVQRRRTGCKPAIGFVHSALPTDR